MPRPKPKTVSDVLDFYRKNHVIKNVASHRTYAVIEDHLKRYLGDQAIKYMKPTHATAYSDLRENRDKVKPTTARRELAVLSAAINFACKYQLIGYDEKCFIPKPPAGEGKDRWLSKDEASRLLSECAMPPDIDDDTIADEYIFSMLGLHTAARTDAIVSLTWQQVDFENEVIHYNPKGRRKTNKRRASVPMSGIIVSLMEQVWDQRDTDSDYVFGGSAVRRRAVRYRFRKACERADLTDVTPHTLRHTYGTWAAQRGVPLWKIAGVMGDTVKTTAAHYLHHCPDELRDAV